MSHPPFAHNPHVYNGIDPDDNPTTSMVVTSRAIPAEEGEIDGERGEATNIETGVVTPPGEQLPNAPEDAYPAGATALEPAQTGTSDEDAPVDVDGDGLIAGYEVFTKADLVKHIDTLNETRAEDNKLSTAGNKPDLVRRIQEAEAAAESGGD